MDSRVGHFRAPVCASDGHQMTEDGNLGGDTAQAKVQSCEKDEGTRKAGG